MQIVIPMSGFGERFRRAGYTVPKPFIMVEGKYIIQHVIDLFPGERNFLFICNQEHLDNPDYRIKEIIKDYCPNGQILGIKPHKLGPVHTVLQARDWIDPEDPVLVNYCDFTCYWNWENFKNYVEKTNCDAAIPCYKGFHPHSLGNTNYAYIKHNSEWIVDIQEKQPFTKNRMNEFASSGTYYFSKGRVMLESMDQLIEDNLSVNNEYYVSLVYKSLIEKGKKIAIYPIEHFMQWGTPEDLHEYNYWSKIFKNLVKYKKLTSKRNGSLVIPMAGLGKRFQDEGYTTPKPAILVSGLPMVLQAVNDLPNYPQKSFVIRKDMLGSEKLIKLIKDAFPTSKIIKLAENTAGQAVTSLLGLNALESEGKVKTPITFCACDNGIIYDQVKFDTLLDNPDIDIIVWCVRGHSNAKRHPEMFGWISEENGQIFNVSVKKPLSNPSTDPIMIGTFTFKSEVYFRNAISSLIKRDGQINNEFYLDSLIEDALGMGLNCHIFEIDSYMSWGTPSDLKTFEYWQSCFHKWEQHPYDLLQDKRIPRNQIHTIIEKAEQRFAKVSNFK